jgi:transcriptional regulator with XRE-family HTH domain
MSKLKTKVPNPIDIHVGSRLRMRRVMLGLSQEKLAAAFGLTFQQVQKYEKGVNRMGSSRLRQAAHILDVSVPFFSMGRRVDTSWRRTLHRQLMSMSSSPAKMG